MKITRSGETFSLPEEKAIQRLRGVCQDFEAFLLSFVFKRAFQPVFGSSLFSSQEESWFREMWVDEVAKNVARQEDMGIAKILFQRLMEEKSLKRGE